MKKKIIMTILTFIFLLNMPLGSFVKADIDDTANDSSSKTQVDNYHENNIADEGEYQEHHSINLFGIQINSNLSPMDIIIIIAVIILIIGASRTIPKGKKDSKDNMPPKTFYQELDENKIKAIAPHIDIPMFKVMLFQIFKDVETAWINNNLEKIKTKATEEVYNTYVNKTNKLNNENAKTIENNIEYLNSHIINFTTNNNTINVEIYLNISCYKYTLNKVTNTLVSGIRTQKQDIEYLINYQSIQKENNIQTNCPHCHAPLPNPNPHTCPYCDSIISKSPEYIMTEIKLLSERPLENNNILK